jgi:type I restriction enzyme R subunit
MYNDKPLQKHTLIQTISRANRKYPGKEYGLIIDYIGIRDQLLKARKMYGGENSVALTEDDMAVFDKFVSSFKKN